MYISCCDKCHVKRHKEICKHNCITYKMERELKAGYEIDSYRSERIHKQTKGKKRNERLRPRSI